MHGKLVFKKQESFSTPTERRSGSDSGLLLSQCRCRPSSPTGHPVMIHWDLISHDEMLSNIYNLRETVDGRRRGRWSVGQRVTLMTYMLIGGRTSAKGPRVKVPGAQGPLVLISS